MPRPPISTGVISQMATCSQPSAANITNLNRQIFCVGSVEKFSEVMPLAFGKAWILTAYHLPPYARIFVNVVSPLNVAPPMGGMCVPTCGEQQSGILIQAMARVKTNCKEWTITADDMRKTLAIPGHYQFELSDDSLVGEVILELQEIDLKYIPTETFFGKDNCCNCQQIDYPLT